MGTLGLNGSGVRLGEWYHFVATIVTVGLVRLKTAKLTMKLYEEQRDSSEVVDIGSHRFPYCVVWTPIPFVSYVCPWVGHTGVCW